MKKIFLSALLFVMLISMSVEKAEAQCASGDVLFGFIFHYVVPNSNPEKSCDYLIKYCLHCEPSGNATTGTLVSIEIAPGQLNDCMGYALNPSNDPYNPFDFEVKLSEAIKSEALNHCYLPPCDGHTYKPMEVRVPVCLKVVNYALPNNQHNMVLEFCPGEAYCVQYYNCCWDNSQTPAWFKCAFLGKAIIGQINCTIPYPNPSNLDILLPPGKTWNDNWVNPPVECFYNSGNTCQQ
ncbi:MAG: hypothetical protein NTW25_13820 [Candidatus Kapabacteria bacterium]|nr:hypothetical protein [Candidatus Kapabacteria bacterium]